MDRDTWPASWLRAALPLAVLASLRDEPRYGYAISADLAAGGFGKIKGGTLYPLLARLEADDLVTAEWCTGEAGPGRKYFTLTTNGRTRLRDESAHWQHFTSLLDDLMKDDPS